MAQNSTQNDLKLIKEQEIYELSREQAELIDNISTQVWYIKNPNMFGLVNKASADFFGVDKSFLNGKPFDSILSKDETQSIVNGNKEVFNTKKRTIGEIWITNINQEKRLLSIIRMPKLDQHGNVEYIICLVQDFTNIQKPLKFKPPYDETSRIIINITNDEIMLIDIDGIIIDINDKAAKNAHKSIDEMIGNSIYNFMPSDLAEYIDIQKEEAIHSGKNLIFDIDISGIYLEISLYPILNNKGFIDQIAIFTHDITPRKLTEKSLKDSKDKYKVDFEHLDFYRNLFIHDMGNILNIINMSLDLYLNKKYSLKEHLDLTQKAVERGKKLMSNLIKLSQINTEEVELEQIDISQMINEAVDFILKSNPSKKIAIDVDVPDGQINAKANYLILDVFENLLNNSVRYNDNEIVEILIKVSIENKNDTRYLKIEFQDNGFGISNDNKAQIFERNYKKKKGKGMGIGLSLVNEVIKRYNGKIWVENRVENDHLKGSNFILLIPEF